VSGWVKLKNIGAESWQAGTVWLAPIPRDQPSPFASPSWKNDHRISSVTSEVTPGQVGEFALDITGSELGESILSLGWVAEGNTWFADAPNGGGPKDGYFAVKVNVVEPSSTSSGGSSGSAGSSGSGGKSGSSQLTTADSSSSCRIGRSAPGSGSTLAILGGVITALCVRRRRRNEKQLNHSGRSER
jgi:hypothetical protein